MREDTKLSVSSALLEAGDSGTTVQVIQRGRRDAQTACQCQLELRQQLASLRQWLQLPWRWTVYSRKMHADASSYDTGERVSVSHGKWQRTRVGERMVLLGLVDGAGRAGVPRPHWIHARMVTGRATPAPGALH